MLKWLNNKKKDNKGFSLVELIIVVAIMAILVGLLAPQYVKYVEKSRKSADASNLSEMVNAVQIYAADAEVGLPEGDYTITMNEAGTKIAGVKIKVTINGTNQEAYKHVAGAVAETAPDYENTKVKSTKWDGDLVAKIHVDDNGGTKVTYTPEKLQNFVNNKTASE